VAFRFFNQAIAKGILEPLDGTITMFPEQTLLTGNIKHLRRIAFTADYSKRDWNSFRGATWVSIHNGGGVGWGEVNGGFGMVLMGLKKR
jgi:hypothetical protein